MAEVLNLEQSWDIFFYYGKSGLDLENRFDLYQIITQPKRSLFYNRKESAGLSEYENNPNGINLQVLARYDIANAVAYRNTIVVNGSEGLKDRRIAVSQNTIGFEKNKYKDDQLDISIFYFSFFNYTDPKIFSASLGSIGG